MIYLRKLFPDDNKWSLNHFLNKANLPLKYESDFEYFNKYFNNLLNNNNIID